MLPPQPVVFLSFTSVCYSAPYCTVTPVHSICRPETSSEILNVPLRKRNVRSHPAGGGGGSFWRSENGTCREHLQMLFPCAFATNFASKWVGERNTLLTGKICERWEGWLAHDSIWKSLPFDLPRWRRSSVWKENPLIHRVSSFFCLTKYGSNSLLLVWLRELLPGHHLAKANPSFPQIFNASPTPQISSSLKLKYSQEAKSRTHKAESQGTIFSIFF